MTRHLQQYDSWYEIVLQDPHFVVKVTHGKYSGVTFIPRKLDVKVQDREAGIIKVIVDYDFVDTSPFDADALEVDLEFQKVISNIMLNMEERYYQKPDIIESDTNSEMEFLISDDIPDGEVSIN